MNDPERIGNGLVDNDFGQDSYYDPKKARCSPQHLEYMQKIVWPIVASYRQVLVGQRPMSTYTVIGMLAVGDRDPRPEGGMRFGAGHVFYLDYPGKGKTLLAKIPAILVDASSSRFQGASDALPADYTGGRIIDIDNESGRRIFRLIEGPGFTQIQLLDEFTRNSPRTQSAVLEGLGEGQITIFGKTYKVNPFAIITANPVEIEGTYKLSEAFLDRVMFMISGERFTAADFAEILRRTSDFYKLKLKKIASIDTVREVREFFHKEIYVDDRIRKIMGRVAEISNDPHGFGRLKELRDEFGGRVILSGFSGRGITHWEGASKTLAAFRYRNWVTPEDIRKTLSPVLRHRLIFAPGALRFFAERNNLRDTSEARDFILKELIREAW